MTEAPNNPPSDEQPCGTFDNDGIYHCFCGCYVDLVNKVFCPICAMHLQPLKIAYLEHWEQQKRELTELGFYDSD